MKNRKYILYYVWLILFGLVLKTPVCAQSLTAVFEEGRVHLIGSASFECVPDYGDWASMANVVRYYSQFAEQVFSGGKSVSVDAYDEYVSCMRPGAVLNYTGYYAGGYLGNGPDPKCILGGLPAVYASTVVPQWPAINVYEPQDIVSGVTDIRFDYEYFQYYNNSRRILVYVNNELLVPSHIKWVTQLCYSPIYL